MSHSITPEPYFPDNLEDYAPWVAKHGLRAPYGKCQCSCGEDAPIAKASRKQTGLWKGEPVRFVHAHGGRVQEHPCLPIERFWDFVIFGTEDGCWGWSGSFDRDGYALLSARRIATRAHRISYFLHYGPIPKGMFICHHCDNRACTRPDHLFAGTPADNMADMIAKQRHKYGAQHWKSKLCDSDIIEIRSLLKAGISQDSIAKRYGVSQSTISHIFLGKGWTHIP